jgi:hypothetical protein
MWRTIDADGCTWDVRSVDSPPDTGTGPGRQMLEFQPREANRPPRRVIIDAGDVDAMDEETLRAAYLKARPIGGDHYGRPGKTMGDAP